MRNKEYIYRELLDTDGNIVGREYGGRLIRCKDCIYFAPEKSGEHWNICRFYDAPKKADGYCDDAESKGEQ